MTATALIFPHQLFADHPALEEMPDRVLLVEEPLFFGDPQYPARFHKLKLAYHRATMTTYADRLREEGFAVERIGLRVRCQTARPHGGRFAKDGTTRIIVAHLHDFMLEKRLTAALAEPSRH